MMLAATVSTGVVVGELVLGLLFGAFGYWLSERHRRVWGRTPWGLPSLLWALIFFLSLLIGAILFLIAKSSTRRTSTAMTGQSPPWYPPSVGSYGGGASYPPSSSAYPPPTGDYPPPGPYPASLPGERPPGSADQPPAPGGRLPTPMAPEGGQRAPQSPGGGAGVPLGPAPTAFPPTAYAPPGHPPGYVSPDPGARSRPDDTSATPSARESAGGSPGPSSSPAWLGDPTLRHELRYWNGDSWTDWVSDSGRTATDPYAR